jgi:hypothetical protein
MRVEPQVDSASEPMAMRSKPATAMKAVFIVPEAETRIVLALRETVIVSAEKPRSSLRRPRTRLRPRSLSLGSSSNAASRTSVRAAASTARCNSVRAALARP